MATCKARDELLATVASLVPAGGARVGIDGADGAGKTWFADELAAVLRSRGRPVARVSIDDFHQVRAIRYRQGRESARGFFEDSYDYARFTADVLAPFAPGGSRRYRPVAHNVATDELLDPPPLEAIVDTVLVVDGLFLHRDELRMAWDFSILLEAPPSETAARMLLRDGPSTVPADRYHGAQHLYRETCRPARRATLVIDNSDLTTPRIMHPSGPSTM